MPSSPLNLFSHTCTEKPTKICTSPFSHNLRGQYFFLLWDKKEWGKWMGCCRRVCSTSDFLSWCPGFDWDRVNLLPGSCVSELLWGGWLRLNHDTRKVSKLHPSKLAAGARKSSHLSYILYFFLCKTRRLQARKWGWKLLQVLKKKSMRKELTTINTRCPSSCSITQLDRDKT